MNPIAHRLPLPGRTTACLLALLALTISVRSSATSPDAVYFRIATPGSAATILSFTEDGWLSWSNSPGTSSYLVEKSDSVAGTNWTPILRGPVTNSLLSAKITEPRLPRGMCFIPGGHFVMGNILADPTQFGEPTNPVAVSPFFLATHEVTVEEYTKAINWAHTRSLIKFAGDEVTDLKGTNLFLLNRFDSEVSFSTEGFRFRPGRGNYPIHYVNWYGSVTYCNWVSEMEGREPCYDLGNWSCDFTKTGYRLPTEAEWEIAARGGYERNRFPWAHKQTTTHSDANYRSSTNNVYDVSPTRGLHPIYSLNRPGSNPVGAFFPNNYGLYDMSGNVWEWVWDWFGRYSREFKVDPRGPATGVFKIFRGGAYRTTAERTTVAVRFTSTPPDESINDVGFRVATTYRRPPPLPTP